MKLGLKNIEFSTEKISEELKFQLDFFFWGGGGSHECSSNLAKTYLKLKNIKIELHWSSIF